MTDERQIVKFVNTVPTFSTASSILDNPLILLTRARSKGLHLALLTEVHDLILLELKNCVDDQFIDFSMVRGVFCRDRNQPALGGSFLSVRTGRRTLSGLHPRSALGVSMGSDRPTCFLGTTNIRYSVVRPPVSSRCGSRPC